MRKITVHMVVNLLALASVILGFVAIYRNKVRLGKTHYTSYHGKLGVFVFASTPVVVAGGLVSFKRVGLIHLFPDKTHALIKRVHRLAGMQTFVLSFAAIVLGTWSIPGAAMSFVQFGVVALGVLVTLFGAKQSRDKAYEPLITAQTI